MSRATAWFVKATILATVATGVIYGWMRYFAQADDPYAIVNHPWQPAMQHYHILAAPFLIFGAGLLWRDHIWPRIRNGFPRRRRTGLILTALLLPMTISGYLLQVAVSETWRTVWVWTHVASSTIWTVAFVTHVPVPCLPVPCLARFPHFRSILGSRFPLSVEAIDGTKEKR